MPHNPKTAPFPTLSYERRIEQQHYELHRARVEAATAQVDTSAPHQGPATNPKAEQRQHEREFEVAAENARLFERLAAIEDLDTSQLIQPSTARSSLNFKQGMYYAAAGSAQCVDHINLNAGLNPLSLHYNRLPSGTCAPPLAASRAGSVTGSRAASHTSSRAGSCHSSRHATPLRGASFTQVEALASVNGGQIWTGSLVRTSLKAGSPSGQPQPQHHSSSGSVDAPQEECSTPPATSRTPSHSATQLPHIHQSVTGSPLPPRPPAALRSRHTSPARAARSLDSLTAAAGGPAGTRTPTKTSGSHGSVVGPAPGSPFLTSHTTLRASSPSRLHGSPQQQGLPPRPANSRSVSPMRGTLHVLGSHSSDAGRPSSSQQRQEGAPTADPMASCMDVSGSMAGSLARTSLSQHSLEDDNKAWRQQHQQRKAELASVYLASAKAPIVVGAGGTLKVVRPCSRTGAAPYAGLIPSHGSRPHSQTLIGSSSSEAHGSLLPQLSGAQGTPEKLVGTTNDRVVWYGRRRSSNLEDVGRTSGNGRASSISGGGIVLSVGTNLLDSGKGVQRYSQQGAGLDVSGDV